MRVAIGAVVAALLLAMVCGWLWAQSRQEVSSLLERNEFLSRELGDERTRNNQWLTQFELLGATLGGMHDTLNRNRQQLDQALVGLANIEKSEGDSDETIECLDRAVPVQLDRGLQADTGSGD
jgi:hypothetical protein